MNEIDSIAFENFFHDYVEKYVVNNTEGPEWGKGYWDQWGFDVVESQIEFKTPQHRIMFLLRWL